MVVAVRITDTTMTSDVTAHRADLLAGRRRVSWLPGRYLTRDEATTAMTLAEALATTELTSSHRLWPHIDAWAAELGLSGPDAVVRASIPFSELNGEG